MNEPPPAYSQQDPSHLAVPSAVDHSSAAQPRHRRSSSAGSSNYTSEDDRDDSAIPDDARQTILDEQRPLPDGWRREFDANSGHYFYVDTLAQPPRSIWSHPLDPEYLNSHPEVAKKYAPPAGPPPGVGGESGSGGGDDKHSHLHHTASHSPSHHQEASTSSSSSSHKKDDRTLGRKLKDKLTGTTHDQRVADRKRRREAEQKQYEAYLARRKEILRAQAEGRYQPMYAAPAGPYARPMGYGGYGGYGYGGGYGRYGGSVGMGYGGMGTGMALGGGLLGGLLLGDMLF